VPSSLDTLCSELVAALLDEHLGETLTHRKRGSQTEVEDVADCIVERDVEVSRGEFGFVVDEKGERTVRLARLEVPADTELHEFDQWEIDGEIWDAVGIQIGQDAAKKTVMCKLNRNQTGRRPRTQR